MPNSNGPKANCVLSDQGALCAEARSRCHRWWLSLPICRRQSVKAKPINSEGARRASCGPGPHQADADGVPACPPRFVIRMHGSKEDDPKVRRASICDFASGISRQFWPGYGHGSRGPHRRFSVIRVFASTTSLRMIAVKATFGGFPFWISFLYIVPYAPRRLMPDTAHM